jgi:hypothetical protein
MAQLEHFPKPIRVRLRWADGRLQAIDGTIDGLKIEWFQEDESGKNHRFEESGEIDADGYHIFNESN